MSNYADDFFYNANKLINRLDPLIPNLPTAIDWQQTIVASWQKQTYGGYLQPIAANLQLNKNDLVGVSNQYHKLQQNTKQLLQGLPCNHALLWGARGTGKSSLIRALLAEFAPHNLRLIEVERDNLADLPQIVAKIIDLPQKFILFCDDLSFEAGESDYRILKSVLDGSLAAAPDNLLLYATSNRRHLVPEKQTDNDNFTLIDNEIHPSEAVEDKIALSDRFGLHLSFYPFSQEQYLQAVQNWITNFINNIKLKNPNLATKGIIFDEAAQLEATRFASSRGNRNGRCAYQFAKNWVGLNLLT